ncbi:MAG: energy transducer TonB, partial [Ignavibacteriales bacterium]|nr:energy transducer TonB [Ignavibacteriales bacterium]
LEAAKDYKFKPAKANGKFVGTTVTIPFKFKLVPKGSYPLKEVEGKLTTKDLEDALSFLGVGIARFTYELPFKHRLIVSAEQFVQGKQQGTHPVMQSTTIPKSGKRAFTLLIHKKDQQLSIGLNADGVLSTMSGILVKGYNVDGSTTLSDATLQEKIKTPFFIYVASKQGGIIVDSKANVEELISKYELAVVFYVELEPL